MSSNNQRSDKWTERDWFWTVGILLVVLVLVSTNRLVKVESDDIVNYISLISSSASIVLAAVAIRIAHKQDSDNQRVSNQLHETLIRVEEKLKNVGDKVDQFDFKNLESILEENYTGVINRVEKALKTQEDLTEEQELNITKNLLKSSLANIMDDLKKEMTDKNEANFQSGLKTVGYGSINVGDIVYDRILGILKDHGGWMSEDQIREKYVEKFSYFILYTNLMSTLNRLVDDNKVLVGVSENQSGVIYKIFS